MRMLMYLVAGSTGFMIGSLYATAVLTWMRRND